MEPAERLRIDRAALLLVDLQRDFLAPDGPLARLGWCGIPAADVPLLVERCQALVGALHDARRPVVFVTTAFRADYADCAWAAPWRARLPAAGGGCLVEGSAGRALLDGLAPRADDYMVVKKGHGAFLHTVLDRLLANLGAEHCIIAGGDVPGSISDTVRLGAALGYEQFVVEDAVYPLGSPDLPTLRNRVEYVTTRDVLRRAAMPAPPRADPAAVPCALLVVDIQNDFVHRDGAQRRYGYSGLTDADVERVIANNQRLIAAVRARGWPVIFVRDVQTRHGLDTALPRPIRRLNPMPPEAQFIKEGAWGAAFVDALQPQAGDVEIVKRGNSAFGFTPLHRALRNLGVRHCLVSGGAVHGCLSDTVREGAGLGYALTIVADAAYPPDSPYLELLTHRAGIRSTDEVLAALDRPAAATPSGLSC
ncbi:MAG TPA: isochorismatase family cysteine hydrolase [Chloroflexota bacterium]|jgi:nicotinamidase-related amidase